MASTPEFRLQRIERVLDASAGVRRGHSWRQLVYLSMGVSVEDVGPPERVGRPGEPSLEDLVHRCGMAGPR